MQIIDNLKNLNNLLGVDPKAEYAQGEAANGGVDTLNLRVRGITQGVGTAEELSDRMTTVT